MVIHFMADWITAVQLSKKFYIKRSYLRGEIDIEKKLVRCFFLG